MRDTKVFIYSCNIPHFTMRRTQAKKPHINCRKGLNISSMTLVRPLILLISKKHTDLLEVNCGHGRWMRGIEVDNLFINRLIVSVTN